MLIRILLLLLSAFFLSWSTDDHIDFSQCGQTTECFARQSCEVGVNADINLMELSFAKLKSGYCDVIVQIRAYSHTKWHVMMQVNASDFAQPITDAGIVLKQEKSQFACDKNGPTANLDLFVIVPRGSPKFEEKYIFCSFVIETKDGNKIRDKFASNDAYPSLNVGSLSFEFDDNYAALWTKVNPKCNADMIKSPPSPSNQFLQDAIDKYAFPPFSCEIPRTIIITRKNAPPIALEEKEPLSCLSKSWAYTEISTQVFIPKNEQFEVSCGVKFCTLCSPLVPLKNPGCTAPSEKPDVCKTAICPDKQWMLGDGRILIGEMECKQDEDNERKSAWYFENGSVSEKVTKAACFDKTKACSAYIGASAEANSKFDDVCVATSDWECTSREDSKDNTEITCPANFSMRWVPRSSTDKTEPARNATKLTCHFPTGEFRDEKSNVIYSGSKVYCVRKKEIPSAAAITDLSVMGGIAGGIVLVGAVVALIYGGVVLCRKRKLPKKAPNSMPIVEVKSTISDAPNVVYKKQLKKDGRGRWLKQVTVDSQWSRHCTSFLLFLLLVGISSASGDSRKRKGEEAAPPAPPLPLQEVLRMAHEDLMFLMRNAPPRLADEPSESRRTYYGQIQTGMRRYQQDGRYVEAAAQVLDLLDFFMASPSSRSDSTYVNAYCQLVRQMRLLRELERLEARGGRRVHESEENVEEPREDNTGRSRSSLPLARAPSETQLSTWSNLLSPTHSHENLIVVTEGGARSTTETNNEVISEERMQNVIDTTNQRTAAVTIRSRSDGNVTRSRRDQAFNRTFAPPPTHVPIQPIVYTVDQMIRHQLRGITPENASQRRTHLRGLMRRLFFEMLGHSVDYRITGNRVIGPYVMSEAASQQEHEAYSLLRPDDVLRTTSVVNETGRSVIVLLLRDIGASIDLVNRGIDVKQKDCPTRHLNCRMVALPSTLNLQNPDIDMEHNSFLISYIDPQYSEFVRTMMRTMGGETYLENTLPGTIRVLFQSAAYATAIAVILHGTIVFGLPFRVVLEKRKK